MTPNSKSRELKLKLLKLNINPKWIEAEEAAGNKRNIDDLWWLFSEDMTMTLKQVEEFVQQECNKARVDELEKARLDVGNIPTQEEILKYSGELRGKWDERKLVLAKLWSGIKELKDNTSV